jgi:hypothetical protein
MSTFIKTLSLSMVMRRVARASRMTLPVNRMMIMARNNTAPKPKPIRTLCSGVRLYPKETVLFRLSL